MTHIERLKSFMPTFNPPLNPAMNQWYNNREASSTPNNVQIPIFPPPCLNKDPGIPLIQRTEQIGPDRSTRDRPTMFHTTDMREMDIPTNYSLKTKFNKDMSRKSFDPIWINDNPGSCDMSSTESSVNLSCHISEFTDRTITMHPDSDDSPPPDLRNDNICPSFNCGICHKTIHHGDQAILCKFGCGSNFHRVCTGLTEMAYRHLTKEPKAAWLCDQCAQSGKVPRVKFL